MGAPHTGADVDRGGPKAAPSASAHWRERAACRDLHPSMFFPGACDTATANRAKAVCAGCPVADRCLTEHLHEPYGIWGGMGTTQREAEARRRRQRDTAA